MKISTIVSIVLILMGLMACLKPEPVIYRVSRGMSEQNLRAAVGEPVSVKVDGSGKTFLYQSMITNWRGRPVNRQDWHVHLTDGKVDSYGSDAISPVNL